MLALSIHPADFRRSWAGLRIIIQSRDPDCRVFGA